MILGRFWLGVILEPVVVGALEVLKLDAAVVFVGEQLQDGEDERLVALLGQVELDQLEDRVQFVALGLRQQLGNGLQFGESDDCERVCGDELVEGLLLAEDVFDQR